VMPSTRSERGYRPSTALAEFVRCRDLTCRFPGCHQPAEVCDLDHTVPFPLGLTHASNLKLLVPLSPPSQHTRKRAAYFWMVEVRFFAEPASDRCVYVIVE
jgi:hypothetical protein